MDSIELTDKMVQKAEWRNRLFAQIIDQRFDAETMGALLLAGISQARAEGIEDAAEVCEMIAAKLDNADMKRALTTVAHSLRNLIMLDKATEAEVDGTA